MSLLFQIEAESGTARLGRLSTPHGEIATPVFMPVGTAATVKAVSQDILEELGVQILLGNTYHLYLRPGVDLIRKLGGLHRFMSWDRAILTDSGGFQVFSLSELRKVTEEGVTFRSHLDGSSHFFTPEHAIAVQIALGADIIMAFDECTEYPADTQRLRSSMERTLRWAERSKKHFQAHQHEVPWHTPVGKAASAVRDCVAAVAPGPDHGGKAAPGCPGEPSSPTLFGIVQGGMDLKLRKESAERTVQIGFPGYAIGGLSVGEPRHVTREVVEATLEYLPKNKPRYLMGVGTPEEIAYYANLGVDMMDCVLPTRAARHGLLFTSEGRISIKQARYAGDQAPLDPDCTCRVCTRYSRAYLRHLYASNEVLAQVLNSVHNLSFYLDTMRRVRDAISLGDRARVHSGAQSARKS